MMLNGHPIYDMDGNVAAWTTTWMSPNLTGGTDPSGPTTGENRVVRGGGWYSRPAELTVAYRSGCNPNSPGLAFFLGGIRLLRITGPSVKAESEPNAIQNGIGRIRDWLTRIQK